MEYPLELVFDIDLGARPATYIEDYTASTPVEHEIAVAFLRDDLDTRDIQNSWPFAWTRSIDVPNIGTKSKLIIHYGYLLDENGNQIITQSGDPIIAENEYTYFISKIHADAYGVTKMDLTLTAPN